MPEELTIMGRSLGSGRAASENIPTVNTALIVAQSAQDCDVTLWTLYSLLSPFRSVGIIMLWKRQLS